MTTAVNSQNLESSERPSKTETLIPDVQDVVPSELLPVRATRRRFVVLFFAAAFMFGNYYFFDQTSSSEESLKKYMSMSENTFGLLSSVYSYPNVILPLFGGLLIDRVGVRFAAVFFTALVLTGSALFSFGVWTESIPLLLTGRVIFGLGGESQNVTALTLVSKWFAGRELAFACAVLIAVSRLGSVAVLDSQPALIESLGITAASAFTTGFCFLSLCSAGLAALLDGRADKKDASRGLELAVGDTDGAVRIMDLCNLGTRYWLVTACCVATYVAAFPFIGVLSAPYLKARFSFNEQEAGFMVSNINTASAILSPILGIWVDRFGRRPALLVISAFCFAGCHITFMLSEECYRCYSIMGNYVLMGVALSVYGSVIWPCIPLVVEKDAVGTAFGLTTALQNLGMAISPSVITALHSSTGSFTWPFLYIIGCCMLGSLVGVVIWVVDSRRGGKLSQGN